MRVFKNKWFNRWANGENITDLTLWNAASDVIAGKVEADLGGYLFKKRLARTGKGKSGGYRTIIGYRKDRSDRIIFLYAFPKNLKANISSKEEEALSTAAENFLAATEDQVNRLLKEGLMLEVKNDE